MRNSFLVLPIVLIASFAVMFAGTFSGVSGVLVGTAIAAMVMMRLARDTINESARKAFQTFVPEERRGRVTNFVDNYMIAGGSLIGCILTGTIILIGLIFSLGDQYGLHYIYQAIGLASAFVSLWAITRMRATYDASLFNWRLKRRSRGQSVLNKLEF